jgi:mono/diheme cytochrome c family protein
MKKKFIFLAIMGLMAACGAQEEKSSVTSTVETPKEDGEKVYKTYCVTCHGLYGNMGGSGAFDLTTSKLSLEERILVIAKGRNVMMGFETLMSAEKIKAVAEYTLTLKGEEE